MFEPVYTRSALAVFDAIGFDYYRSEGSYRTALRGNGRGLWSGAVDLDSFTAGMEATVSRGLRQAFSDGITLEGLTEDDLTQDELTQRDDRIASELGFINALGTWISERSKDKGGKLADVFARMELWVARYNEVRYLGQLVASRDKKLEWRWNPSKEHCDDCRVMHGRVYRASTWLRYGIMPQSANLACFGTRCGCGFYETDKPVNKGRPPALKGPK